MREEKEGRMEAQIEGEGLRWKQTEERRAVSTRQTGERRGEQGSAAASDSGSAGCSSQAQLEEHSDAALRMLTG